MGNKKVKHYDKARNLTGEEKEKDFYRERGWKDGYKEEEGRGKSGSENYTPLDYFYPGSIELDRAFGDSYKSEEMLNYYEFIREGRINRAHKFIKNLKNRLP